jgi:hypothetical protein
MLIVTDEYEERENGIVTSIILVRYQVLLVIEPLPSYRYFMALPETVAYTQLSSPEVSTHPAPVRFHCRRDKPEREECLAV